MTKKKTRVDTVAGNQEAFANATKVIKPPKELNDKELFYWEYIVEARPINDWTRIDLMHAWNLAKLMSLQEDTYNDLDSEGRTIKNDRGTPIDNPAISRLDKLTRLVLAASAKLKIHAEATVGESRDMAKRSTSQRRAKAKIEKADNLIARPLN